MTRDNCLLNIEDYPGMCYSCRLYDDYGPVGGRFANYNGRCTYDGHESDALVKCTINQYKCLFCDDDYHIGKNRENKTNYDKR